MTHDTWNPLPGLHIVSHYQENEEFFLLSLFLKKLPYLIISKLVQIVRMLMTKLLAWGRLVVLLTLDVT